MHLKGSKNVLNIISSGICSKHHILSMILELQILEIFQIYKTLNKVIVGEVIAIHFNQTIFICIIFKGGNYCMQIDNDYICYFLSRYRNFHFNLELFSGNVHCET